MSHTNSNEYGRIVGGVILVLLGGLFLVSQFLDINLMRYLWPGFIILPGVLFFIGMLIGGRNAGGLAIPGTIITTTGLLLFYQNLTGLWQTWSFAWALVGPVATGLGLVIFGLYSGKPDARKAGMIVLGIGLALLAIFGISFGFGFPGLGRYLWPLVLIALGIFVVLQRSRKTTKSSNTDDGPKAPGL
ncbi:MAG: hypothetical protein ACYCZF_16360 [Anaerolineae bacterium]